MTSLGESEGARRARHFCALERRLFELVGGWVPSVPEPEAKILLRVHSFQHAWHAELWGDLLPVGTDAMGVAAAPLRPGVEAVLDQLAAAAGTVERVGGLYCVFLPRLVKTYEQVRRGLGEASDGPVQRAISLVLADLGATCRDGARLVEGLEGVPGVPGIGGRFAGLEAALASARGLDASEVL